MIGLTLGELIVNGQQAQIKLNEAELVAQRERLEAERERAREAQEQIRELLPTAIREYTFFEDWHRYYMGEGRGWTVQALITCPKLAPIRVYCIDYQSMVSFYSSRYGTEPFNVLEYKAEKHDGQWYTVEHQAWSGSDIELALYQAANVGLTKEQAEAEVQRLIPDQAPTHNDPVMETPQERFINALVDFIRSID